MSMEPTAEGAAQSIAIALCNRRVLALEQQCRVLAAEVDRMRPVVERVSDWLLSKGAPARAVALSEAYDTYKAGAAALKGVSDGSW